MFVGHFQPVATESLKSKSTYFRLKISFDFAAWKFVLTTK